MKVSMDDSQAKRMFGNLQALPNDLWQDAGDVFKNITPRDTGNAQRNTRTTSNTIEADYAYAQRLDTGWSKQNGGVGMTKPTLDWIGKNLPAYVKRAGG